ncbi:Crp/Fnr family transcriptional regulator [Mucilaginibacter sp. RB4R14]|uniref:Crp/Fnr family transcriptional regulator n=1 Tax=Mucilaginibacter aurantiaciroseus TaxID=2949308 RepID=UPI0020915635|nr:Crp/Fnr family transcriptional regulator [Mucilaginibacter aurantiaciroseus]MCO5935177.1 Crp/Fnr family transcriptional regulator [Mucilaginibacter aurantiaciroseus]
MLNTDEISFYLSIYKELSLKDMYELVTLAKTRKIAAGEVYIDIDTICHKVAFIKSGLIRGYHLKENGEERTLLLRWENQFIAAADTIVFEKPSRFIYQALEDTVIMELDFKKAQPIINNNPRLSAKRNAIILGMLAEYMERVESFVLLSTAERYMKLVHDKPDIVNRVPNKYLATLLGITPVSLSRIRKRIASPKKR